jgi:hypothetical protein
MERDVWIFQQRFPEVTSLSEPLKLQLTTLAETGGDRRDDRKWLFAKNRIP